MHRNMTGGTYFVICLVSKEDPCLFFHESSFHHLPSLCYKRPGNDKKRFEGGACQCSQSECAVGKEVAYINLIYFNRAK